MHSIHSGRSPVYLADMVEPTSARSTRRLRSTDSGLYDVPRLRTKFGERAFSFSGPSAWNALPADIRDEICTATFKKKLKTFYFFPAFDCIWHRFYVTIVMHLRSDSSGGTTKFLTWTWTWWEWFRKRDDCSKIRPRVTLQQRNQCRSKSGILGVHAQTNPTGGIPAPGPTFLTLAISISMFHVCVPASCILVHCRACLVVSLTLWRPLLPHGYSYKASCARPGYTVICNF